MTVRAPRTLDPGAAAAPRARALPGALSPLDALAILHRGRVEVDPSAPFEVSWWDRARGSRAARLDASRPAGDPHTSHTLATLAGALDGMRAESSPKGSRPALCGAAFRPSAEGAGVTYRPRSEDVRALALLQLDVDGREGDPDGATLADGGEMAHSLAVGAAFHATRSALVGGGAAERWRGWFRLATRGAGVVLLAPGASARARADLADAVRCCGAILAAALGAGVKVDRATHRASALGYVDAGPATLGGVMHVDAAGALDPFEVRAAARAAGAWPGDVRGPGERDPAAFLELLRAVEEVLPGTLGPGRNGVYPVRCVECDTHTGDTGRGAPGDASCAFNHNAGFLGCSHTSHGPMNAARMIARWCELAPHAAGRFRAIYSSARTPTAPDLLRAAYVGAPGDTAGGRVEWQTGPDGAPVIAVATSREVGAEVADLARAALLAWSAGDRRARLLLAPTGCGKSWVLGAVMAALAAPLPGELDDKVDSPRPCGAILVETREAMHAAARGVDTASAAESPPADLVPIRRGRHGSALRAAVYLPLSRVGADGRDVGADPDAPRACVHRREAERYEGAGISARGSLCGFAGTDDPDEFAAGKAPPGPCPRRALGCTAEARFHYLDGTTPRSGDAWIAVATGAAAPAIPEALAAAPLIVDETARLVSVAPVRVSAGGVGEGSPARTFAELLPDDTKRDEDRDHRPRASVKAVFRGLLALVEQRGAEVLLTPAEGREALALEHLARWGEGDPTALEAWPTVGGVGGAWQLWCGAPPTLGKLRRRRGRTVDAAAWHALHAWADGADALPAEELRRGDAAGDAFELLPVPGAVDVLAPSPAAALARRWIARGPVIALDATPDVGALAGALRAGAEGSPITGILARALDVPDAANVRRVIVRTGDAGRGALTLGHGPDARVAWAPSRHTPGAARVTARALREVLRAAPRLDGSTDGPGPLAPVVIFAPPPLARSLRALAEASTPEQLRAGSCPAARDPGGAVLSPRVREALARSVEGAPLDVRALAEQLAARCGAVWWSYPGSTFSRGSNAPHRAGARCVVTVGDGLLPPFESARRARAAGRDASADGIAAQACADAARELAQRLGRVRVRAPELQGAHVLLLHVGTLRPIDWPCDPARVEVLGLAALDARAEDAAPVEARAAATVARLRAPTPEHLAPVLAAARAARWTVGAVARACGVAERTVRRWQSGATSPTPEQLAPLASALASAEEQTRAAYRAMLPPGRRVGDLVRGKGRGWSRVAGLLTLSAEGAAAGDAGVRELRGVDLDAFEGWVEGRAALSPSTVATLAALAPAMALRWGSALPAAAPAPSLAPEAAEALARVSEHLDALATLQRAAEALPPSPTREHRAEELRPTGTRPG